MLDKVTIFDKINFLTSTVFLQIHVFIILRGVKVQFSVVFRGKKGAASGFQACSDRPGELVVVRQVQPWFSEASQLVLGLPLSKARAGSLSVLLAHLTPLAEGCHLQKY